MKRMFHDSRNVKCIALLVMLSLSIMTSAQVRLAKLVIQPREVFDFGKTDIIVVDTLVMMDSSRLVLNRQKSENYVRAKVAIFGKNCWIYGNGVNGKDGWIGGKGKTAHGPCQNGSPAAHGPRGGDGAPGVNLFLYLDEIIVNGNLVVDLSGGDGGDGGEGGEGGGGSAGTVHCNGGDGGRGGNGGQGGNGGRGGNLTFGGAEPELIKSLLGSRIIVNVLGGNRGYGGSFGLGGAPGLGPSRRNGKAGARGRDGEKGKSGENGIIQYEHQ